MPLNTTLMDALRKRYGDKADEVYWGMVGEAKGPFAPGGKYHAEHVAWAEKVGVRPSSAPPPKKRSRRRRK